VTIDLSVIDWVPITKAGCIHKSSLLLNSRTQPARIRKRAVFADQPGGEIVAYHLVRNILIALMTLPIGTAFAIELDNSVITGTPNDSIQINAAPTDAPVEPSELSATATSADNTQAVLQYALSHEGKPYRRGASSPEIGFDCSGFVRHIFDHAAGVVLPHKASALSKIGSLVKKSELYPGDLVFFRRASKAITHVGIYLGNNQFIHASSRKTGRVVVSNLADGYWARHYFLARRLDLQHKE